jgi:WD40 repeat protein
LQTLWDDGFLARYNKEDRCLSEKTGGDVTFCAFSPDGAVIVALGGGVRWWEAASGAELKSSRGMYASSACAFSPDGSSLVAANGGDLTIWNGATGAELRTLADAYVSEYYTGVKDCAFSADGSMIASVVGRDEDVLELRGASYRSYSAMLWDAATGRRLATLKSHTRGFNACAFSADGRLLATVCDDGMLEIWNCETKSEFCLFPLLGGGTCVAWHPWLPRLVCGDASGCVYLIDVVGVELAPVVVTAWLREDQTDLHCPACREEFPFEQSMLGQEITCPQPGCGQRLRVNSFVARPLKMRGSLRNAASRLAFWKH